MKRFYSHYTYIYPDTYLKNSIVELDDTNNIINVFPFEKEIEKTTFHPGLLFFVPNSLQINPYVIEYNRNRIIELFNHDATHGLEVKAIICNIDD